ncbi:SDR family NAD(P)-dependent oxidoreductase [Solirubrobacter sp. CPCC 204708]|uniref:Oxidoreductase n=1 Tax=Solirubrobacter deserti TaxID=2282478 RepID=A0ABT4RCW5_9ACTN|nr:oxidoreductase [Solirubrobacter deserti]MBE2317860.1 SDR family NAD(P)-dependent oxidoreductase [Solirubrobacter deserti]MDA0136363.1 oxidoreductase [Solirubrobacter deserti]
MSPWTATDIPDQTGRTYVITGANSGIGLAAAREVVRKGARVILAVRNTAKGEEAARGMPGETEVRALDLADLSSVRAFAQAVDEDVAVLVNNAGVMNIPLARTADGFEMQFGTNHLGHFALTNLLLPRITDRVVVVASGAHRFGKMRFDDLNWEQGYQRHRAYGQAKLSNLLFMSELQRELEAAGSSVRAVGAHPGWAATNLQRNSGNPIEHLLVHTIGNRLWAQSGDMGALPTLFAATQDIPGDTYIGPDGRGEMRGYPTVVGRSAAAQDAEAAARLWAESERLTGVSFPREASTLVR